MTTGEEKAGRAVLEELGSLRDLLNVSSAAVLVSVAPTAVRRGYDSVMALEVFRNTMRAVGIPWDQAERVLAQEAGRRSGRSFRERLDRARERLLTGPPHDGTCEEFERMLGKDATAELRDVLLTLYEAGGFDRETTRRLGQRTVNHDET